jgi:hypothetical protein
MCREKVKLHVKNILALFNFGKGADVPFRAEAVAVFRGAPRAEQPIGSLTRLHVGSLATIQGCRYSTARGRGSQHVDPIG